MILSLARDPLSYFQSYRNYFISIYLAFLAFPSADLVLISSSQATWMILATQAFVTAGCAIAIIWGYVATKLYLYPEPVSLKRIITNPPPPIFLLYGTYLVPMILGIAFTWGSSSISVGPSAQVTYVLEGVTLPSTLIAPFLLAIGGAIVVAFTFFPFAVLVRLRAKMKDKEVRGALTVIASTFSVISVTILLAIAISSFGYSVHGPANFLSVALLIVAVRAFRKPTFLKSFLGVVPSLESSPTISRSDQMILIYSQGEEKFGPISKYIVDAVNRQSRVIYFHHDDEALVMEGLSQNGIDVRMYLLRGVLRLLSWRSIYQTRGIPDEIPLEIVQELALEARTLSKEGLRIILDYDDSVTHPTEKFVQHLTDPRWTTPDHYVHVLMAFNSATFRGNEATLAKIESKIRTLDLSESIETFSKVIEIPREEIIGRKLLLEFDPQASFERIFRSVFTESASNFERSVIFTRKDSPIYLMAQRQPGARIFVLTSRVSYPRVESENRVLLPAYDTSQLLDALNRTIEAYSGSSWTIIFDNISHYVFTLGQDRTYALVRQALELIISNKITAIFSINSKAHDQKTVSTFENMFDIEVICALGTTTPQIKRLINASA